MNRGGTEARAAEPVPSAVPRWERRTRQLGWLGAGLVFAASGAVLVFAVPSPAPTLWPPLWLAPVVAGALGYACYELLTRNVRRRERIRAEPFPPEWARILTGDVAFYRALSPEGQSRFRRDVQLFLGEKRITGIGFELDETTRVLVGASAVIPVFGYPEWEWHQISEVLVYADRFDAGFKVDVGHQTLGMVGTGALHRMMVLSRPDLLRGFRNAGDKRNVGLHEFAHLVDKSDGTIDGVPIAGLDRHTIGPWVDLVRREMDDLREGKSDIHPYALTNEAEFFAVACEYFFERPALMRRKHPDLFAMLDRIFRQDLASRAKALWREVRARPAKIGRNSPCPCGSGRKFKKCCLRTGRAVR